MNKATGPTVRLVESLDSKDYRIEIENLKAMRDVLSHEVVNAFCRCFVHIDRLTSLAGFAVLGEAHHGTWSCAYSRDLHTVFWYSIGTLHELSSAIENLRSAMIKQRIPFDTKKSPWLDLNDVEKRWRDKPFRRLRDQVAYHVDSGLIEKGLDIIESDAFAIMCEGLGPRDNKSTFSLGLDALLRGCALEPSIWRDHIEMVSKDQGVVGQSIQQAFVDAVKARGIPVVSVSI